MDTILTEKINNLLRDVSLIDIMRDTQKVVHRGGSQYLVQCPFHSGGGEKNPSMSVDDSKGLYKCFTCNESGNIIKYLKLRNGMSFKDAIEYLGKRFSIDVSDFFSTKGSKKAYIHKESKRINKIAMNVYGANLLAKDSSGQYKNKEAVSYLKKRQIPFEVVKKFKLGYAPRYWDLLTTTLNKKGIKSSNLVALGLSKTKNNQRFYDAFINRIIFPIINENEETIGFGGRSIDGAEPKYLNSKESLVFKKKFTLYGINVARNAMMKEDTAIIVEGYMDVIAMQKMGITNVVGTLGTACTEYHIKLISKYCKNIVFAFDNDDAGIRATEAAFRLALKENFNPTVLIPNGVKDFDEYFTFSSIDDFNILYGQRIAWYDFLIDNMLRVSDDSLNKKIEFLQKIYSYLVLINQSVALDSIMDNICSRLSISKQSFVDDFEKYKKGFSKNSYSSNFSNAASVEAVNNNNEYAEEKELIYLLIINPKLIASYESVLSLDDFRGSVAKDIYAKLLMLDSSDISTSDICLALDNKHITSRVESISQSPMYTESAEEKINLAIKKMRDRSIKEEKQKIIDASGIHNILQGEPDIDKLCNTINRIQSLNKIAD